MTTQPRGPAAAEVQSVHRALDILEVMLANEGRVSLGEIAARIELPLSTVHRLLKTLCTRGFARQLPSRRYALGFRLVPLGVTANALLAVDAEPLLCRLVAALGESANLAILSGDRAEYAAQVSSAHSVRMFTEVGRKVPLHCTGVGKALLSQLCDADVSDILRRTGLPAHTPQTVTTEAALRAELATISGRGYAVDEQEREWGVRCVAVPVVIAVAGAPLPPMAVSVSGPASRVTDRFIERAVPLLRWVARQLGARAVAALRAGHTPPTDALVETDFRDSESLLAPRFTQT